MKTLCIILIIVFSIMAMNANAQGEFKHGLASAAISGAVSRLCYVNTRNAYDCWGLGVMTSFMAGTAFEMVQEDYSNDLQNDLKSDAVGAIIGASIAISF